MESILVSIISFAKLFLFAILLTCIPSERDFNYEKNCKRKALESAKIMLLINDCEPLPAGYLSKQDCLNTNIMLEAGRYSENSAACHPAAIEKLKF